MCNIACIDFVKKVIYQDEVAGKRILEIGSRDFNGSVRPFLELFQPKEYMGIDIQSGPSVDVVCNAEEMLGKFGKDSFNLVISTENLEHVNDWKMVIHNMKQGLAPGGVLLITTRSYGKQYHAYPYDFWRYELDDMKEIFKDFKILYLEKDPISPGVFLKAMKPLYFKERSLSDYPLYSIITKKRALVVSPFAIGWFQIKYTSKQILKKNLPTKIKTMLQNMRKKIKNGNRIEKN